MTRLLITAILFLPWLAHARCFTGDSLSEAVRARLVRDISVLASDSFQGRQAGTSGERLAADYIRQSFAKAGLRPAGDGDTSFYQRFTKTDPVFTRNNRMTVDGKPLIHREEFGITALSANGSCSGLLADAGYGVPFHSEGSAPGPNEPNYRGKVVLIDLSVPSDAGLKAGTIQTEIWSPAARLDRALKAGAAGVIFWNDRNSWFSKLFEFEAAVPDSGIAVFVNQSTARWLRSCVGRQIEISADVQRVVIRYRNVIGRTHGDKPGLAIIGAHYDHLGKMGSKIFLGADDNASGTAGMMELARYYAKRDSTGIGFVFIAFAGEEQGLDGSVHYADHPTVPLDSVRFMINLDMIGRLGCNGNVLYAEAFGSSAGWKEIYRQVAPASFRVKRKYAALPFSDHMPFYRKSFPVVFFNTGTHSDYHRVTDTPDRINYNGMTEIIRYLDRFITEAGSRNISYRKVPALTQGFAYLSQVMMMLDWALTID